MSTGTGKLATYRLLAQRRQYVIHRQVEDALRRCGASETEIERLRKEREAQP